jgi:hypothetical protein
VSHFTTALNTAKVISTAGVEHRENFKSAETESLGVQKKLMCLLLIVFEGKRPFARPRRRWKIN